MNKKVKDTYNPFVEEGGAHVTISKVKKETL